MHFNIRKEIEIKFILNMMTMITIFDTAAVICLLQWNCLYAVSDLNTTTPIFVRVLKLISMSHANFDRYSHIVLVLFLLLTLQTKLKNEVFRMWRNNEKI